LAALIPATPLPMIRYLIHPHAQIAALKEKQPSDLSGSNDSQNGLVMIQELGSVGDKYAPSRLPRRNLGRRSN
jgi:hypothetical protein